MPGTAEQVSFDGTPTNGANPWIDSLVWGGAWGDTSGLATSGGPVTISWAANSGWQRIFWPHPETGIWLPTELDAVRQALSLWESVAQISFVEVAEWPAPI